MRAISGPNLFKGMLSVMALVTAGCFQTAVVQPDMGIQITPVAATLPTAAATATPSLVVVPAATVAPTTTAAANPQLEDAQPAAPIAEEEILDAATAEIVSTPVSASPALSAAQIEATSIVVTRITEEALAQDKNDEVPPATITTELGRVDDAEPIVKIYPTVTSEEAEVVSASSCIHIISAGDTLYGLAQQYNTTVTALVVNNNIDDSDVIAVGDRITIPSCGTQIAESESTVAVSAQAVLPQAITHVVQEGEGLFDIALRYGVSVTAISQANGITDVNSIKIGQVLSIPPGE